MGEQCRVPAKDRFEFRDDGRHGMKEVGPRRPPVSIARCRVRQVRNRVILASIRASGMVTLCTDGPGEICSGIRVGRVVPAVGRVGGWNVDDC